MKKALTVAALVVASLSALAQGTVNFNNNVAFAVGSPAAGGALVKDRTGANLVGTNFVAQLVYGGSLAPAWDATGTAVAAPSKFRVSTTLTPGTWSGGTRSLPGVAAGGATTLQVQVWDGATYASYAAAFAAFDSAASSVFNYTVPPAGSPPAAFFMDNFTGISAGQWQTIVPEPTTVALGLLGVAALVAVRRRK